jgi:hypothetical protein
VAGLTRILKLAVVLILGAVAVWFKAVLHAPVVKRRKAARRRARAFPKS